MLRLMKFWLAFVPIATLKIWLLEILARLVLLLELGVLASEASVVRGRAPYNS
jgi:hypothetical protein